MYAGFLLVLSLAVWAWLHEQWYGVWMQSLFGQVPIAHPGYNVGEKIFSKAPYIAAGIICGMGIGMGATSLQRLLPRFAAPIAFSGILIARNPEHAPYLLSDFMSPLIASCAIWVAWSFVCASLKRREDGEQIQTS
jgi:hypothetical protein